MHEHSSTPPTRQGDTLTPKWGARTFLAPRWRYFVTQMGCANTPCTPERTLPPKWGARTFLAPRRRYSTDPNGVHIPCTQGAILYHPNGVHEHSLHPGGDTLPPKWGARTFLAPRRRYSTTKWCTNVPSTPEAIIYHQMGCANTPCTQEAILYHQNGHERS